MNKRLYGSNTRLRLTRQQSDQQLCLLPPGGDLYHRHNVDTHTVSDVSVCVWVLSYCQLTVININLVSDRQSNYCTDAATVIQLPSLPGHELLGMQLSANSVVFSHLYPMLTDACRQTVHSINNCPCA